MAYPRLYIMEVQDMYIPVLKNRTVEMSVIADLLETGISEKTIPLFEIIQQKTRSNSNKTYIDDLNELFTQHSHKFFLDIPKISVRSSTSEPVREFHTSVNRQENYVYQQMILCKHIPGIIPVISYGTQENLNKTILNTDLVKYHKTFDSIAIRLTPAQYNVISDFTKLSIGKRDYFQLDIGDKSHTNPAFKKIYKNIKEHKKILGFTTFIINSNRPVSLYNKNLQDGQIIEEIDNSLSEMYSLSSYKFDGFGDYAGVANTLPSTGGTISPAGIYYSADENVFIGYKGKTQSLSEFKNHIAPSIIASPYWAEYTEEHHIHCPGCKIIQSIVNGGSGGNQGIWKGITMSHYIYTVDQIMQQ